MKKTAILLMIITILSKIMGFARDITLSYFFGASYITDAYLISITIPMVIFGFVGVGIASGYIPMYSQIEKAQGTKEGLKFTNNLTNIMLVITTIIFILGLIFTVPIVKLFASGFEGVALDLAVKFSRISLFGMYFTGLVSIFNSYLQIKGNYIVPAILGFPMNLITIIVIILSSKGDILLLAIGSLISSGSQLIIVLFYAYKMGYKYSGILEINNINLRKMMYIAFPAIVGSSVNQINVLVDRTVASGIVEGGITALNYAGKLNGFIQGIFVLSITTALFPIISKMAAENDINGLKKTLSESISSVNLLVIPATIGFMIFSEPIVAMVFGRGEFSSEAQVLTSAALFYYSLGMLGFGLSEVLSRAFYALQDTKTPAIYSAIAVTINIVLNIILSSFMGISGLALATSISALISTVLLFLNLRKKIGFFSLRNMMISLLKIITASLGMGVVSKLTYINLSMNISQNLSLVISIALGVMLYLILIYCMKIEEVNVLIRMFRTKLAKSKK
ncbi:murein biosynthesis integral membrane protein MurJ [Proteiniclasticum sp.]|uniref:murein biosynthesis integral membrane protein MurJ n=1 Tax=Proteiniclasticum sp. TaxID=2053595 RepID=UPI00289FED7F|nr:murein biosynthesis integral membrane protein MurJ [Proteiniclasticum sp.]